MASTTNVFNAMSTNRSRNWGDRKMDNFNFSVLTWQIGGQVNLGFLFQTMSWMLDHLPSGLHATRTGNHSLHQYARIQMALRALYCVPQVRGTHCGPGQCAMYALCESLAWRMSAQTQSVAAVSLPPLGMWGVQGRLMNSGNFLKRDNSHFRIIFFNS